MAGRRAAQPHDPDHQMGYPTASDGPYPERRRGFFFRGPGRSPALAVAQSRFAVARRGAALSSDHLAGAAGASDHGQPADHRRAETFVAQFDLLSEDGAARGRDRVHRLAAMALVVVA